MARTTASSGWCPSCRRPVGAARGDRRLATVIPRDGAGRHTIQPAGPGAPVADRPGARAMTDLTRADLVEGFRASGLAPGSVVLVHSALRTLGRVEGGAETVRDALLDVLGPTGTLVAPTFTFIHEVEPQPPLIDPAQDRSEMGAITEAVRRHPAARRTAAYRHSFAAVGPASATIASVDPALAPFDLDSAFGTMLRLDAQVLLLGVPYSRSTSHHFAEWVAQVPYREAHVRSVRLRGPDGRIVETMMGDYQPKPSGDGTYYGSRGTDFNKLGRMLEER